MFLLNLIFINKLSRFIITKITIQKVILYNKLLFFLKTNRKHILRLLLVVRVESIRYWYNYQNWNFSRYFSNNDSFKSLIDFGSSNLVGSNIPIYAEFLRIEYICMYVCIQCFKKSFLGSQLDYKKNV